MLHGNIWQRSCSHPANRANAAEHGTRLHPRWRRDSATFPDTWLPCQTPTAWIRRSACPVLARDCMNRLHPPALSNGPWSSHRLLLSAGLDSCKLCLALHLTFASHDKFKAPRRSLFIFSKNNLRAMMLSVGLQHQIRATRLVRIQ